MIRLALARSPMLLSVFPFGPDSTKNVFDKPANAITKPLKDELGWDRVKNIFCLTENGTFTKELQSIINITLSGSVIGAIVGGLIATKNTVDNFISSNEATRYIDQMDAKRYLQQTVTVHFIRKGVRMAGKLGLFCFMFSSLTTCTTAYRGKLAIENYILGASVTGFLYKMNLGLRAAFVGAGLASVLGGLCGGLSIIILKLSGITMDEILEAQKRWIDSRDESLHTQIKEYIKEELPEIKEMYEKNIELRLIQSKKDVKDHKT